MAIERKSVTAVYLLQRVAEAPEYEGFSCKTRTSFLGNRYRSLQFDFCHFELPDRRDWQTPRLAAVWKPLEVIGRVRKFNDYPCIGLVPAFSQRAVDALREFLEPNGELLPLVSPLGSYWAYNVTTVADVLDLEKSDLKWAKKPEAWEIYRHEFIRERLRGLSIFRIPEHRMSTYYVTEAFAARVRECGLKGLVLVKVWPLPPGVRWVDIKKQLQDAYEREGLPEGQSVKGNSVVVRLRSASAAGEPTPEEQSRVDRMMNEVDALLVDPDATHGVGMLEGNEYVGSEFRLFFSCPDAGALVDKLWPWLRSLDWSGKVLAMKRYGEYNDPAAKEDYLDLTATSPTRLPPVVRERPLTDTERNAVEGYLEQGYALLKLDRRADPDAVQAAVRDWVHSFRKSRRKWNEEKLKDAALPLGCLWGQSVCDKLGWQWIAATLISRTSESYAVAPPERECVVFPMDNIFALLTKDDRKVNTPNLVELYDALKAGSFASERPGSYRIVD